VYRYSGFRRESKITPILTINGIEEIIGVDDRLRAPDGA